MTHDDVRTITLHDLLGRRVVALNGRAVGHIEEVRARRHARECTVTEFLLGTGALLERLAIVRVFRRRRRTLVVRWDQIDLSDPERPALTCPASDLREE